MMLFDLATQVKPDLSDACFRKDVISMGLGFRGFLGFWYDVEAHIVIVVIA